MNRDSIVMLAFAAFLAGALVGGWIMCVATGRDNKTDGEENK